jgi:hypothetical protein
MRVILVHFFLLLIIVLFVFGVRSWLLFPGSNLLIIVLFVFGVRSWLLFPGSDLLIIVLFLGGFVLGCFFLDLTW